jgi:purine-binding chemotaxis protein CheW
MATITQPTETTTATEMNTDKYLVFQIGNETYGVPLLQVQEIRTYTPATRVPNAPDYVLGVINLRGNIIAVIDARTASDCRPCPKRSPPSWWSRKSATKSSGCASTRSPM